MLAPLYGSAPAALKGRGGLACLIAVTKGSEIKAGADSSQAFWKIAAATAP